MYVYLLIMSTHLLIVVIHLLTTPIFLLTLQPNLMFVQVPMMTGKILLVIQPIPPTSHFRSLIPKSLTFAVIIHKFVSHI